MQSPLLKLLVSAILVLIQFLANAQEQVTFKIQYSPGKTYKTTSVSSANVEMNFKGDSAKLKEAATAGFKLPMLMEMLQEFSMTAKAGSLRADKRIPVTLTYDKVNLTQKMNGQELPKAGSSSFTGARIEGWATDDGKLQIDTIVGDLSPDVRKLLQNMVTSVQNNIAFPTKPLKIGDKFSQELPLTMPMGQTPMKIIAKIDYTLKEIMAQKAFFDLTQTLSLDFAIKQSNVNATGTGTGFLVYDLKNKFITESEHDVKMDMNLALGEMDMTAKAVTKTTLKVSIE